MTRTELVSSQTSFGVTRPEDFTRRIVTRETITHMTLGIPMEWCDYRIFGGMTVSSERRLPSGLNYEDVSAVALRCFAPPLGTVCLDDILRQEVGDGVENLARLRTWLLQFGHFAYILMNEATLENGKAAYFVTYLAREPQGTRSASLATEDYSNLRSLSQAFSSYLKSEYQSKFSVVRPTAIGSVEYHDRNFPFFTMPFVPQGELNFEGVEVNYTSGRLSKMCPFLHYVLPYNQQMAKTNSLQAEAARHVLNVLLNHPRVNLERDKDSLRLRSQVGDLLDGMILLYLLSGARVPKEFQVNAGDWVGKIEDSGLKMTLITVRGGWGKRMDLEDFLRFLVGYKEVVSVRLPGSEIEKGVEVYPFLPYFGQLGFNPGQRIKDVFQRYFKKEVLEGIIPFQK